MHLIKVDAVSVLERDLGRTRRSLCKVPGELIRAHPARYTCYVRPPFNRRERF